MAGSSALIAPHMSRIGASGAKYDWQLVFFIFYAWFCTQLLFGIFTAWLKKMDVINLSVGSNSLATALSIALIYLLSNGPVLLYIYFFALRPNKLTFWQGINFRLGDSIGGLFKLFGVGVLAWFAAIPLVLFTYMLSIKLFNCAGSNNPIIAIIMDAARIDNFATILLFIQPWVCWHHLLKKAFLEDSSILFYAVAIVLFFPIYSVAGSLLLPILILAQYCRFFA